MAHSQQVDHRTEETSMSSQWTTDSAFADSAVDVITPGEPSSYSPFPDKDHGEDSTRKLETQLESEPEPPSPASPTLPADYTDDQARQIEAQSLSPIAATMSDKLRQLAAAAWALEQDDEMTNARKRMIAGILERLQDVMEDDGGMDMRTYNGEQISGTSQVADSASRDLNTTDEEEPTDTVQDEDVSDRQESNEEEEEHIYEYDLHTVHDNLVSTVASMRLRTQEQRHLQQLTASKLEAVAQRCISQDRTISNLQGQMQLIENERDDLRKENHTLGAENDELRSQLEHLQLEAQKQSNALSAMGSAVAGLEGWIDSNRVDYSNDNDDKNHDHGQAHSQQRQQQQQQRHHIARHDNDNNNKHYNLPPSSTPTNHSRRKQPSTRTIFRGQGRFRGRYQVDVDDWGEDNNLNHHHAQHRYPPHNNNRSHRRSDNYDNFNGYDNDHDPQNFIDHSDNNNHNNNSNNPSGAAYHINNEINPLSNTTDDGHERKTSELKDDVKSWIRGFRDVLEYAAATITTNTTIPTPLVSNSTGAVVTHGETNPGVITRKGREEEAEEEEEDEWGEFQHAHDAAVPY